MPVKNLMEEIINSIVTEILSGEQDKISESGSFKDDVIGRFDAHPLKIMAIKAIITDVKIDFFILLSLLINLTF